jgi:hypothetical protein
MQDASKLEPGAFYFDRAVHSKHLRLSGSATQHAPEDVQRLVATLTAMAQPVLEKECPPSVSKPACPL